MAKRRHRRAVGQRQHRVQAALIGTPCAVTPPRQLQAPAADEVDDRPAPAAEVQLAAADRHRAVDAGELRRGRRALAADARRAVDVLAVGEVPRVAEHVGGVVAAGRQVGAHADGDRDRRTGMRGGARDDAAPSGDDDRQHGCQPTFAHRSPPSGSAHRPVAAASLPRDAAFRGHPPSG